MIWRLAYTDWELNCRNFVDEMKHFWLQMHLFAVIIFTVFFLDFWLLDQIACDLLGFITTSTFILLI